MVVLVELIGLALVAWSLKVLLRVYKKPIAVFNFEDDTHRFKITRQGYYSISVVGMRSIDGEKRAIIKMTSNKGDALNVRVNYLLFSFTHNRQTAIQCWGFSIRHPGLYTIRFSNLEQIVAYGSMLRLKRFFWSTVEHSDLRILIHRSVKPIYQLGGIIALILGLNLILYGIFFL